MPALLLTGLAAAPVAVAETGGPGGAPGSQPVEFSTALGDAPVLSPGRITTQAPTGNTTTYATIKRPAGGSVAVAVFGAVQASITTADGKTDCSSSDTSSFEAVGGYRFIFLDGAATKRQSYIDSGCESVTDLRLTLKAPDTTSSSASSSAPPSRDVQLVLTEEPKITKLEPATPATGFSEITAASKSTTGDDRTLSDKLLAPDTLTPGSYPVSLQPGKLAVARVRVGWGQRLAASVDAPRNGTNFAPPTSLNVALTLFSPQLSQVRSSATGIISKNSGDQQTVATYTAQVNAANRQLDYGNKTGDIGIGSAQWTTAAGWYTVAIYVSATDDTQPQPTTTVPARLNLDVVGSPTTGPTYADAAGAAVTAPPASQLSVGGADADGGGSVLPKIGISALIVAAAAGVLIWLRRLS
ncbi:hypothetical protein HJ588_12780 [Flexivirga sp. ID2601S]|uniref:Uncharacterized protein n=1 Tax=Flexivirga aerilata TaxID=1656889 RepID=A0A849AIB9_9MICO|nr:hypothetical protein [Flexivirga aerilata]NNG40139.1 hypothetical protein [Flexivirga aerilata]